MMLQNKEHTEEKRPLELISVAQMHHPSGGRIYAHARKTFGLIYVLSGCAIYEFDGISYPVKAGELFCIPQGLLFSVRPIEKKPYKTRQFALLLHDPLLHTRMSTLYPPLTVDPTGERMLDFIEKFWNVPLQENQSLLENFLQSLLGQFYIHQLHDDKPVSADVVTDGYCPATKSVLGYVESHRQEHFSLEEMGQTLGYNKYYLCTAFTQDTGVTILTYVHFQKIRHAMEHFFYWGSSIDEVWQLLAFGSMSHFSTLFRSFTGLSPGAFRKACLALDGQERTSINSNTRLFASRPQPMKELFAGMQQMGEIMAKVLQQISK